jgi:hypothetical protein
MLRQVLLPHAIPYLRAVAGGLLAKLASPSSGIHQCVTKAGHNCDSRLDLTFFQRQALPKTVLYTGL